MLGKCDVISRYRAVYNVPFPDTLCQVLWRNVNPVIISFATFIPVFGLLGVQTERRLNMCRYQKAAAHVYYLHMCVCTMYIDKHIHCTHAAIVP